MQKKQLRVLIVDDASLVVKRLSEIIGELAVVSAVFDASSYDEALQLIHDKDPQIILLDIHLPEKSGLELLEYVRAKYPAIITVMLTNLVEGNYRTLSEKLGAHHFIDKSSEFEMIAGIIESYSIV